MNPAVDLHEPAADADLLLRTQLAAGDRVLRSAPAVLHHLVSGSEHTIYSEEIVARTRGLLASLALNVLRMTGERIGRERAAALVEAFAADEALLAHCHALAVESRITDRLAQNGGGDAVVSPLIQSAIASSRAEDAARAMSLLAAQARFVQGQRRMDVGPAELPADLLHAALEILVATDGLRVRPVADALRASFDEARSRLGLLGRFILGTEGGLLICLDLGQAGLALFCTALALATGVPRDEIVLALTDGQQTRFCLLLLGAGLDRPRAEAAVTLLHPDAALPPLAGLARDRALHLLHGGAA